MGIRKNTWKNRASIVLQRASLGLEGGMGMTLKKSLNRMNLQNDP